MKNVLLEKSTVGNACTRRQPSARSVASAAWCGTCSLRVVQGRDARANLHRRANTVVRRALTE